MERKSRACGHSRFLDFLSYSIFVVGPLVVNAVLVLLGAISSDFMTNPTIVLTAIPSFMFPFASVQLFSGALSDVYGRVRIIIMGLLIFAAGLFLIIFSTSIDIFALANFGSGFGFGFVNPVLLALMSDCVLPQNIPRRLGIASAFASLSVGLGPFVAGQMVIVGWRTYYLVFLIIAILGIIGFSVVHRPSRRVHDDSGVRLLLANLRIELQKPIVLLMLVTTFLLASSYLGVLVWTSRGLTGAIEETLIGILLLGYGISGATAGSLLGLIIRKFGYGLAIASGFLTLFGGILAFIIICDLALTSLIPAILIGLAAVGWAGGLLFPIMISYSQFISPKRHGLLVGLTTFSFFLGSALVPTIYEPLFILGMTYVYRGILAESVVLLLFFYHLFRKIKSIKQNGNSPTKDAIK